MLLNLTGVSIAFSHLPLLDGVNFTLEPGERVAIIGRNGTGKSTLMQILSGELAPDAGTLWRQPGSTAARLAQDVPLASDATVEQVVAQGIAATPHDEAWHGEVRVGMVLDRLGLEAHAKISTLSGGWRRRVLLARALVSDPSLLLLDEPTNHLDVEAIEWLESFLAAYDGAIVFVTHDRAFLQRLATRIVELDRGRLTSWPGDYETFIAKKEAWLENEAVANEKFDKLMAKEEAWLRRGVKARRTRDEGRVKKLMAMREQRAARRAEIGSVRMQVDASARSGQMVFDLDDVSKAYGGRPIVSHFTTRVMRGDRIGLIGPNGSGKTTLLRLMLGELAPDTGTVERGANVRVAYFDQQREQLDPEASVVDTVADGNTTVTVAGQPRHVHGYLEDFLFPPERARSPVKALSGGERNRLLLARLFTRPANVLVLDEPTNDLDIETLELLEQLLVDFDGTILLVSHDRRFLNNVVTSTISISEGGAVTENVGNYDDWKRMNSSAIGDRPSAIGDRLSAIGDRLSAIEDRPSAIGDRQSGRKKLSYKEQREFDALPALIEQLEAEEKALAARVASPEFYQEKSDAIHAALARAEALPRELADAYARWSELEERS